MDQKAGLLRFGRLALQAFSVLLGILVAFGVDAWWDDTRDRAAEHNALEQLEDEFRANLARLDTARGFHAAVEVAATTTLHDITQDPVTISADSLDHLLADLSFWGGSNWVTGSVDAILSSGDIGLIENQELQASIAAWPRAVSRITAKEDQEFETYHELWIPFLIREGYLPQISNAITHLPGSEGPWEAGVPMPLMPGGFDHRQLIGNRELHNQVLIKYWDQIDLRTEYVDFGNELERILAMIETELGR